MSRGKTILIFNEVLFNAIKEKYGSTAELCRLYGMHLTYLGRLINFKLSPLGEKGKWLNSCVRLSEILEVPIEDLFPLDQYKIEADLRIDQCPISNLSHADWQQLQNTIYPGQAVFEQTEAEVLAALEQAFCSLSPNETAMLKLKYGFNDEQCYYTYDQIGELFDVSRERVRQIIMKSIRKLRHPSLLNQDVRKNLEAAWQDLQGLKDQCSFP